MEPLCPAAFLGISHALKEVALEVDRDMASQLVWYLQTVLELKVLSPSAEGYAKEVAFLTYLGQRVLKKIHALEVTSNVEKRSFIFTFNRVRFIPDFGSRVNGMETYKTRGYSVLFLPRKTNEQYVDAAIYDYGSKAIYAIQVRTRQYLVRHPAYI